MVKAGDKIRILKDMKANAYAVGEIVTVVEVDHDFMWFDNIQSRGLFIERIQNGDVEVVREVTMPETDYTLVGAHFEPTSTIKDHPKRGDKFDQNKPRISLIPKEAVWGMARGLTYGEKKYGTHNFRNGIAFTRLADAAMRHLTVWLEGEEIDTESGNSHLDHALASLAMLKFMSVHRNDMDDRWLDPMLKKEEK